MGLGFQGCLKCFMGVGRFFKDVRSCKGISKELQWCGKGSSRKFWFCQTPVQSPDFSLGLGVDFVFPLSQEEQQPPPKLEFDTKDQILSHFHLWYISDIYQVYLWHISQVYFGFISGISQLYLRLTLRYI